MNTTLEDILALIEDEDPDRRREITSVKASEAVWLTLLHTRPDLRRAIASNKHLPLAVLAELAADEETLVRFDIAMKRQLSPELFDLLASDQDESVRARIAYNGKAPREILQRLANDPSPLVSSAARERLGLADGQAKYPS